MSLLSAGIGAGVGLFIGGPIGAVIGALVGNYVGNKYGQQLKRIGQNNNQQNEYNYHQPNQQQRNYSESQQQIIFFIALNAMLAKMAKADGRVTRDELNVIRQAYQKLNLDEEDTRTAMEIFNQVKDDSISIYDYADQYAQIADIEMRELIYMILAEIAAADGQLHTAEQDILQKITTHLFISSDYYHYVMNEFFSQSHQYNQYSSNNKRTNNQDTSSLAQCYALLECKPSDSDETIKQQYRKKIAEFHPDKIQGKGLPESFLVFANEQSARINQAYETIQKSRR